MSSTHYTHIILQIGVSVADEAWRGGKARFVFDDYQTVRTGYCGIILSHVMMTMFSVCA